MFGHQHSIQVHGRATRSRTVESVQPVPVAGEGWDDLVDAGQIVLPEDPALALASLDPLEIGFAPSAELERLRADER